MLIIILFLLILVLERCHVENYHNPNNIINYQCDLKYLTYECVEDGSSKDFSQDTNTDEFTKQNIDYENLKEKLNNIYDDPKLTANSINHIKSSMGSSVEIQWET